MSSIRCRRNDCAANNSHCNSTFNGTITRIPNRLKVIRASTANYGVLQIIYDLVNFFITFVWSFISITRNCLRNFLKPNLDRICHCRSSFFPSWKDIVRCSDNNCANQQPCHGMKQNCCGNNGDCKMPRRIRIPDGIIIDIRIPIQPLHPRRDNRVRLGKAANIRANCQSVRFVFYVGLDLPSLFIRIYYLFPLHCIFKLASLA